MEHGKQSERTALLDANSPHRSRVNPEPIQPGGLPTTGSRQNSNEYPEINKAIDNHIWRVLPIAFTAAFSIAATSATSIYAYASITCADPSHCKDDERNQYAGVVASATTTASVFGIVAVWVMRHWSETHPKLGLSVWLVSRSLGIGILAIGVLLRSIRVAIAGQIFEGLANDNLLHYTLASIYVKVPNPSNFSRLMGSSLALYMMGTALSPTAVTWLPNFFQSFIVAMSILGLSLIYLIFFVHIGGSNSTERSATVLRVEMTKGSLKDSIIRPIQYIRKEPKLLLHGFAILAFNTSQAYLFPLIMVHASLKFGFSSRENGYIVSLAASVSSIYLFIVVIVIPKVLRTRVRPEAEVIEGEQSMRPEANGIHDQQKSKGSISKDLIWALLSMVTHLVALPLFMVIRDGYMVFILVVLVAFGLAAPSFMKSHIVTTASEKGLALSVVAMMESLGGLFSPIILGSAQAFLGGRAFAVACCLVGIAMLSLAGSLTWRK